ncbi:MAG: S8 family serine peptidase [Bacteroidetes bacterium]|nr:S8 family serine peptidase [Bacteroidota bacterium]
MKNFLIAFALFGVYSISAQPTSPRLSAAAHQYLWRMKNEPAERNWVYPGYVYRKDNMQQIYISTFLKVEDGFSEDALQALGVQVNTRAGNIWTAQVPVERFQELTQLSGLRYIDMDAPVALHLDSARAATHVDSVHEGVALPQAYTGKNVVVGIIDAGFDYTHPAFYDTAYNQYRVKRVWEQKTSGIPPAGFSYGAEYTDSASIHAKGYDVNDGSHGTHVAGIAGGSGYGGDSTHAEYRGMAYSSDLVFVAISPTLDYWLTSGMADMLDGVQYIYNYAQSVSKPAIANLSWGGPLGPHDGTGLFSQAMDNLSGPGKYLRYRPVTMGLKIHLQKTFSPSDISVNTFLRSMLHYPLKPTE